MGEKELNNYSSLSQVIHLLSELVVFNNLDFNEFLKKLIKATLEVVPADACLIYFYDKENKNLILVGSKKPHVEQIGKIILAKGEGITGWAAEHMETVAIESKAYKDPRFKKFEELPEDKYESFLSVPIINETGLVGVINLQNEKPYKFSKDQIKTVEALVKIISSAFVKILLERKIDLLQNKLEERQVVEKAKGILMKEKNLSEQEAYNYIRRESMDKRKNMKQIAEAILLVWN